MIRSMTGYGKAENNIQDLHIKVEIRSLNGKQLETRIRSSPIVKPFEIKIRNILKAQLLRGSLEVNIQVVHNGAEQPMNINTSLAKNYYHSIKELATELDLPQNNILDTLLTLPDVMMPASDSLSESQWESLKNTLLEAIEDLDTHRKDEGKVLEEDLISHIQKIERYQQEVKKIEPERKNKIRERLEQALEEGLNKEQIDQNRLEQELIFYIEKLDLSEEQVRLANHCRYFHDILAEKGKAKGKKLNFLLQEIGREINTTGAKANDAELQRCVVKMKDELDKAKEQIMNIL